MISSVSNCTHAPKIEAANAAPKPSPFWFANLVLHDISQSSKMVHAQNCPCISGCQTFHPPAQHQHSTISISNTDANAKTVNKATFTTLVQSFILAPSTNPIKPCLTLQGRVLCLPHACLRLGFTSAHVLACTHCHLPPGLQPQSVCVNFFVCFFCIQNGSGDIATQPHFSSSQMICSSWSCFSTCLALLLWSHHG